MTERTAALITGASRGLGRALARRLAERGHPVVLVAREREPLLAAVAELAAAGCTAHAIEGDLGDPDDARSIAARATALVGRVGLLVHNASTLGPLPMPSLADTTPEDLAAVLEVNLLGPFRLTRALLGGLALGQGGTVLHISSDAAVEAYPGWGAYSVSKAALDHLSRVWAAELADAGVRVLSVDPGEMDTKMHADAIPGADRSTLADPEEVARRIVALLHDPEGAPSGARVVAAKWEVAA
ncbi:SDR family NAD(P)-dependent oxidoreductase [Paraliomyxa miuraensis]|uniref:SDR family NAD(P)-dependent oxidoreductase n=1 Tax=Paraliomyxa miuraensis TaxID=376150 RepID=UPI00225AE435|nr:SDR family oxidoreductase [Paraliomyxa miuraensis]MCX4241449.1 SDR family oxidoreductase [Paraliomyxa miuraensis]